MQNISHSGLEIVNTPLSTLFLSLPLSLPLHLSFTSMILQIFNNVHRIFMRVVERKCSLNARASAIQMKEEGNVSMKMSRYGFSSRKHKRNLPARNNNNKKSTLYTDTLQLFSEISRRKRIHENGEKKTDCATLGSQKPFSSFITCM